MLKILEGQKFGRLTALHDTGESSKQGCLWSCLCECGQFVVKPAPCLIAGNIKSCGCLKKEAVNKWVKGHIENKISAEEANLNRVFNTYKRNAKKRDRGFLLTKEQFKQLSQQDCFYCGTKPHNIAQHKYGIGKFIYNGIDRIDNNKGYVVNNCVACCFVCNEWKKARTQQEFLMRVKLIYDHMLKDRNARILHSNQVRSRC